MGQEQQTNNNNQNCVSLNENDEQKIEKIEFFLIFTFFMVFSENFKQNRQNKNIIHWPYNLPFSHFNFSNYTLIYTTTCCVRLDFLCLFTDFCEKKTFEVRTWPENFVFDSPYDVCIRHVVSGEANLGLRDNFIQSELICLIY
jgi:hypothetical protein